jgi:hypothetical protein
MLSTLLGAFSLPEGSVALMHPNVRLKYSRIFHLALQACSTRLRH